PCLPVYGANLGVVIDGAEQRESVPLNLARSVYAYGRPSNGVPVVLLSQSVNAAGFQGHFPDTLKNADGAPGVIFSASDSPATRWSTNWLGYSRYDGVVVTGDELREVPSAVQAALFR